MDQKERFIELLQSTGRQGIDGLIGWLESSDFFTAPASSRFHGNYVGGLLDHSLNVYEEFKRLLSAYPEVDAKEDSVIIASLLHDLCKVNFYTVEKRNRKTPAGQWEQYDFFAINEKFCFGGHGSKSVFLAQNFIKLTPEEAVAINCHMSSWDGNKDVGNAFSQYPFAWLLHVADESATYIRESKGE